MTEYGRYPTHEEIQIIIARARRLRSECVAAMFVRAVSRVRRLLAAAGPRRVVAPRIYRADSR